MFERVGLLLPANETHVPVDAAVHTSFVEAHDGMSEAYRQLTMPEKERISLEERFKSGAITDFDLTAQHLEPAKLTGQISRLELWRSGLEKRRMDERLKAAYDERARESIANLRLLLGSRTRDMAMVAENSEYIYGKPDEPTYRAAVDWLARDAERHADHSNIFVADAAQQVRDMLSDQRGDSDLIIPDAAVFEAVRNDHYRQGGYYALLLAGVTLPEGTIRPEVGNSIVEYVVRNNLQSHYRLRPGNGAWGVVHSEAVVEHPAKYGLSPERFVGLPLGHEVGSHLLEGVNGTRGPIALAGPGPASGLDRYELGNEGRALIREQVVYENFKLFEGLVRWRDILRRYVAIGYGSGTGSESPQPSSEVYKLINAIDSTYAGLVSADPQVAVSKAHAKTWALLTRELKGTDGTGGAYGKDMVYLDGHVKNWQVAATYGPEVISEGDLGKLDITNPRHVALFQDYGLLKPRKETHYA
jgi:hypothetical protein